MSALYLETSALVAWLLGEPRAAEVGGEVEAAETIVTSALTLLETKRALVRGLRTGLIREADERRLHGMLTRAQSGWMCMEVQADVLERAARPFPVEPVRTVDALHLATALAFATVFSDLSLLSFERRIADNAEALGIAAREVGGRGQARRSS